MNHADDHPTFEPIRAPRDRRIRRSDPRRTWNRRKERTTIRAVRVAHRITADR